MSAIWLLCSRSAAIFASRWAVTSIALAFEVMSAAQVDRHFVRSQALHLEQFRENQMIARRREIASSATSPMARSG